MSIKIINRKRDKSNQKGQDRLNRMTPSPAAPSPGQQPTPPPSNQAAPGQQKQKPSMPSWFSSMTSTTQQGKNNQPMTPSPSQERLNHL